MLNIGLNRAVTLIAEAKASGGRRRPATLRELGAHPDGGIIGLYRGRYGPYVGHGGLIASLPRGADPDQFTLAEAVPLLAAQKAKGKTAHKPRPARAASNGTARRDADRAVRQEAGSPGRRQEACRRREGSAGQIETRLIEPPSEPINRESLGRIVGVFRRGHDGGRVVPADRRDRAEYLVAPRDMSAVPPMASWSPRSPSPLDATARRVSESSSGSACPKPPVRSA